jgi:putative nucleotidyltransferase with HDIG domain
VSATAVHAARTALAGESAWLVGGTVRDRLLGRPPSDDLDLVVDGDVPGAARALARTGEGTAFPLSEAFGAWRVTAPRRGWQADLMPLGGAGIEEDLRRRDFTVNALAEPLHGGEIVDPAGGLADLEARRLRMVSPAAFDDDPLRVLRLARLACELGLDPEPDTVAAARGRAARLSEVAPERVFAELRRVLAAPAALDGLALMDRLGATGAVLPELEAMRGVQQSRFHHLDVREHTLAVLGELMTLERDPGGAFGEHAEAVADVLREPLADELTRAQALRLGALLHDVGKPRTRAVSSDGRVTFRGHDDLGAEQARAVLTRLRTSERLRAHVAALARHHLRLGFLVHDRPLDRRTVHAYLRACEPVEVDVTVLSIADRLATRGDNAETAIAAHLDLARELLGAALRWRREGPPHPLLRGDELAAAMDRAPGPGLGGQLADLEAAQYAGEVVTREDALAWARKRAGDRPAGRRG